MARKDKNTDKGPYPMHAGEYCGNHHPVDAAKWQKAWLDRMRFGKPRPCKAFGSEEGAAQGYVGLYLKESRKPLAHEIPVPTPPELMEPGREALYNISGPGIFQVPQEHEA